MENHKRVLGILFIIMASFQIMLMLFISLIIATVISFVLKKADPADAEVLELVTAFIRYIPAIVIIFLAVPGLIAGFGLLARKSWALIFALVIGCLHLLSFPFGTALGVYTIWVYSEDQRMTHSKPV